MSNTDELVAGRESNALIDPEIRAILGDRSLSQPERIAKLRDMDKDANRELSRLQHESLRLKSDLTTSERTLKCLKDVAAWAESVSYRLERNDCTRLHKFAEASNRLCAVAREHDSLDAELLWRGAQVFVVQHDWAAAFQHAKDYDSGEFTLPYSHCAFEFRISGRTVIVIAAQDSEATQLVATACVESVDGCWLVTSEDVNNWRLFQFLWAQIRAISIALDADIATREVVRAPMQLNAKRIRNGIPPIADFTTVVLRGRAVQRCDAGSHGTHRSPRLHFRRGHWRHYETHKTWIRWTLVGNPDYGFIDKTYRL